MSDVFVVKIVSQKVNLSFCEKMWFPLLEVFEYAQNFKIRFGTKDFNTNVNLFFIYFVFISVVFTVFRALSLAFIKVRKI